MNRWYVVASLFGAGFAYIAACGLSPGVFTVAHPYVAAGLAALWVAGFAVVKGDGITCPGCRRLSKERDDLKRALMELKP